jgi:hypothetical protein
MEEKNRSYRMRVLLLSGCGVDPEVPALKLSQTETTANDKSECEENFVCENDHDLPKQTTISPQFSLFLANVVYFLVAFCAALVTLPAPPLSVLTTDLMTLYIC